MPLPPSEDPFYTAPPGFESFSPGTVLRIRNDPSNITTVVNGAAAYNILYRSTDARYNPSWAVTTLLIPHSNLIATDSAPHLVSYQIAYNSPDVDASPSYLLSTLYKTAFTASPADDVAEALARGWYVNFPDFEGPLAAFCAGPQEGFAVLDSIRAILSQNQLADWENARYAMWGYSGGSLATFFAAELQASYAPEMKFAGAAIGGLPSNVTQVIDLANNSPIAGLMVSVLLGVTAQFPKARNYLIDNLKTEGPFNATAFLAGLGYNLLEYVTAYQGQDIYKYFVDGVDILRAPELVRVFGNNAVPTYHGIPRMPLFAYHAISDKLTPIGPADLHIKRYCDVDVDVLYQRNTLGGHDEEGINGRTRALEWLTRWLNGDNDKVITGCTVETVTVGASQQ